jgi:hypothetical protein
MTTPGAAPSVATGSTAPSAAVSAPATPAATAGVPSTQPASGGNGPSVTDWLTMVIAAVALVVAAVVGYAQVRLQRQVTRIERERRDQERQRELSAQLAATWLARGEERTVPELLLSNRGEAAAAAITVTIASAVSGRLAPTFESRADRAVVDRLGPGQEHRLLLADFPGTADTVTATLSWRDGRGSHQESVTLRTE